MLIFDLENKETFNNLSKWQNTMKNNGVNMKEAVIMLIGNKCDGRTKEIDQAEVIAYAKKKGFQYFQASANTGQNINEVFEKAFNKGEISLTEYMYELSLYYESMYKLLEMEMNYNISFVELNRYL